MPHKQIAEYLYEKHGLSGWWSQVVTVVYEQERGLREKHQKSDEQLCHLREQSLTGLNQYIT